MGGQGVFCFFKMEEDFEAKMPAAPRKEKKTRNKISKRFQKDFSSVDPSGLRASQNYKRISFYYSKPTCVKLLKCRWETNTGAEGFYLVRNT